MSSALTRRQMREKIRINRLGVLTPVQMGITGAVDGDAPTQQPDPSNAQINDAIDDALSWINAEVGFNGSTDVLSFAVTAQTADGSYQKLLSDSAITGYASQIKDVRSCGWVSGTDDEIHLKSNTFEDLERTRRDWRIEPVGTPIYYIIESYAIYLWPSPDTAGTVYMRAGLSLSGPASDSETIAQLPSEFFPVVMDLAAMLCCQGMPGDIEMQARIPGLQQRVGKGVALIRKWYNDTNKKYQGSFTHRSHRTGGRFIRTR